MQEPAMMAVYLSELRFPERAEFLDDYQVDYEVHLAHWATVGERFAPLLRKLHTNVTSRLLVVCGDPGSGIHARTEVPVPLPAFGAISIRPPVSSASSRICSRPK